MWMKTLHHPNLPFPAQSAPITQRASLEHDGNLSSETDGKVSQGVRCRYGISAR
jgi:hypothetical protein